MLSASKQQAEAFRSGEFPTGTCRGSLRRRGDNADQCRGQNQQQVAPFARRQRQQHRQRLGQLLRASLKHTQLQLTENNNDSVDL